VSLVVLPGPEGSHVDHVTPEILDHLRARFSHLVPDGVHVETFEMPKYLGTLPCNLYGPDMGDGPIEDGEDVAYMKRANRVSRGVTWLSRTINRPPRPTRTLTVVLGPADGDPCVLYTAYAGPAAPREPGDPDHTPETRAEAAAYWDKHALSVSAVQV